MAVAGCEKEPPIEAPPVEETVTTRDLLHDKPTLFAGYDTQEDCEAAGGEWKSWCRPNKMRCVMSWPDGGKSCTDSSECASKTCMVDLTIRCESETQQCTEPDEPATGSAAVGICKTQDVRCGSYIEIKKGIAQELYHID
jgi:hypothetical protein